MEGPRALSWDLLESPYDPLPRDSGPFLSAQVGEVDMDRHSPQDLPSVLPTVLVVLTQILCSLLEPGYGWLSGTQVSGQSKAEGSPRDVGGTVLAGLYSPSSSPVTMF